MLCKICVKPKGFTHSSAAKAPLPNFSIPLQTLHLPHKTARSFAKPLPRLYRTMVDTRKKRRYNRVVPMRTHPKHYTKNNIGEKGEYFT